MIDLVAYYSQVVSSMKQDIEWIVFDKAKHINDKVHKKHMNYLIKTRTKELNKTIKKLEKLKALNKPLDPFDYCEGVSEEQKQAIRNSPTALEKVTRIAQEINNSPFKHTHAWCLIKYSGHTRATTCIKEGKLRAALNRYRAYTNTHVFTTSPL